MNVANNLLTNCKLKCSHNASNSGTRSNGMAFMNVDDEEGGSKDNEMEDTTLATQGKGGGKSMIKCYWFKKFSHFANECNVGDDADQGGHHNTEG